MNMQIASHSLPLIYRCYVTFICIGAHDWLLCFINQYLLGGGFSAPLTESLLTSDAALVHKLQQFKVLTFLLRWRANDYAESIMK